MSAPSQYGTATVYAIDGTVAIDSATALAVVPESLDSEDGAQVEEFMDGNGEIVGFAVRDHRVRVNVTLLAKATTKNGANAAFAFPSIPARVTLASFPSVSGTDTLAINGDWIYTGGASRGLSRGQATLRIPVWKSLTGSAVNTLLGGSSGAPTAVS